MRFFARIVVVPLWFLPFEFNPELPFSILEVVIDYGRIKISHQLLLSRGYLIVLLFRSLSNLLILSYMALQQIHQDLYEHCYLSCMALQQMCQDFYARSELYDPLAIHQGFFLLLDNVFEYFYVSSLPNTYAVFLTKIVTASGIPFISPNSGISIRKYTILLVQIIHQFLISYFLSAIIILEEVFKGCQSL
ncbi:hypothetical protein C2G38_2051404 [Gigaspora rosea]|uniref:Uncharacterized protein n=1 Tax=Gigaspora rosea TaxID=44941 RepID=A0A397U030_9GLOM|nr:hypothetical protein C2G38_2051404 [Gigaspora rosea]